MLVEISRQADNLHWLVDILIDRRIADDFVRMWAHQAELATLHMQVPVMFRYEVSRLTARLCIAIGKGQVFPSPFSFGLYCEYFDKVQTFIDVDTVDIKCYSTIYVAPYMTVFKW